MVRQVKRKEKKKKPTLNKSEKRKKKTDLNTSIYVNIATFHSKCAKKLETNRISTNIQYNVQYVSFFFQKKK